MGTLIQDLRYGLRTLRKSPPLTSVAIFTLAVGIGANTAIFSLANLAFFRPLPYPRADRLAFLWEQNQRTGESEGAVSYPNYADWRAQSGSFRDMAFIMFAKQILGGSRTAEIIDTPSGAERVPAALVSTNLFSVLGVQPLLGREFDPGDALPGRTNVAIISYGLWKSRFGGNAHVIGQRLGFGGEHDDTVIGVMPPTFNFPATTQLWKPRQEIVAGKLDLRQYPNMGVIGRLNPGVSWPQAQAEMNTIAARLAAAYPRDDRGIGIRIVPLRAQLSQSFRQGLLVLWGAIFGVLLIACLNVGNLMLARTSSRQKEIAVRFSLGATRARILRQFVIESLLFAVAGALSGFVLAAWTVAIVARFNSAIARLGPSVLDVRVLAYTVAVTAFSALLSGSLPALAVSQLDLNRALQQTPSRTPSSHPIRRLLIVTEVSLAFVLLVGSGLLIRSLQHILSINPGFDAENSYRLRIYWPEFQSNVAVANSQYVEIMNRVRGLPGVAAVGSTSNVLFPSEMYKVPFVIRSRANSARSEMSLPHGDATPGFFRAMGVPLLRGRPFTDADAARNAPPVAIINETMARRCWANQNAIGKEFKLNDPNFRSPWFRVIGVVDDIRQEGLENPAGMMAYFPSAGYFADDIVVRANGHAKTLLAAIKAQVKQVDGTLAVGQFRRASEILASHESQRRFSVALLAGFAFVALFLAAVGIYSTVSYWVRQRTPDIGIRMALGAEPRDIFALVISHGIVAIAIGIVLGVAGALAVTRLLSAMLFGVTPADPLTYVVVTALIATVALAACYFPARRAMRVEPVVALRYQ